MPPYGPIPFRVFGPLLLAAALAALPSCAARPRAVAVRTPPPGRATIRPIENRIDVVLGRTLVLPVTVQGPVDVREQVAARLDDGRSPNAALYWLGVTPDQSITTWLEPAGRWTATPAGADRLPSGSGVWAIILEFPLDAVGQGVWINETRFALNWLPDPGSLSAGTEAWPLPLGEIPRSSSLLRLAAPELASPLRRWRYSLLMSGLRPDARPPAELDLSEPMPGLGMVFDDPVLEAVARQTEARWQIALGNLWLANPDLADRLKRRLVAAVDFLGPGPAVLAPAWPTSQADLDALLSDLLNPRLSPAAHAERAAAWLDSQPPATAWVTDDAGLRDAQTGRPVSTCTVANLTERATLAWASRDTWPAAAGLTTVAARGTARISVVADESADAAPRAGEPLRTTAFNLHAGEWETERAAMWMRLPARPPGLRFEPLFSDWTMVGWLTGEPDAGMVPAPEWAAAALLYRNDTAAQDGTIGLRWMLMVECRTAQGASPENESIRVWLGPYGSPTAVLKATATGVVVDERAPDSGLRGDMNAASIAELPEKWVAQIPIPARAIEPDGTLRIGLERTDSRARRTAWPRPMLPWQSEPGRVAVDTTTWGDLRN